MLSRSDVLPWSTCPITTTTGERSERFVSSSSVSSISLSSTVMITSFSTLAPSSSATSEAVSKSTTSFIVAITPRPISFFITSVAVTLSLDASSETTISSGIRTLSCCFLALSSSSLLSFSASVSFFENCCLFLCADFCVSFCFFE